MPGLLLLAIASGAGLALQAGINARLGKALGSSAWAACASTAVSTIVLLVYALATRQTFPSGRTIAQIPAWGWLGGVMGAIFVATVIVAAPRIGVAATTGLAIGGQIMLAVILDHYGLMGLERHPINPARLLGMVLLIAGVILVKRF
jgi:bacterial/archaeal transporter family-2 protein